ncbi:MAG: ABC transporter substrate-binding protein [Lentisphaerae bacterium]|nr:ABC transporter substrate-binding protein [Lentisphaerota bacterium]
MKITSGAASAFMALLMLAAGAAWAQQERKTTVAVIPKGTTHIFWKSVHAGAVKAARESGVELFWQGPQKEDDRKMQIEVVQNFVSRGVDAIVLAPLDSTALVRPARAATAKNIKLVIIDSGLNSDDYSSFVASDNYKAGRVAAKRMAELIPPSGRLLMLRYAEGSESTMQREKGFQDGMKELAPGTVWVSDNQYGGVTSESAFQAAQNLLNRFEQIDGIFTPNESTTFGMLRALQTSGRAGKVKFVGFDTSEPLLQGLRKGDIHGLTAQNPFKMGYVGVKTAVAAIRGEAIEKRIDTGVAMITAANIGEPEMRELVNPDLDRWLEGK